MLEKEDLYHKISVVEKQSQELASLTKLYHQKIESVEKQIRTIDNKVVDLKHLLSQRLTNTQESKSVNNTTSDNHDLDKFYKRFEDRFRGTEEDIKNRVSEYLPLFASLPSKVRKLPVIDLGCGRGEFLAFAKENKIKAVGVDMNHEMVQRANDLGLEAYVTDAMSYLVKQKTNSVAAITGFHIVEHIPFEALMALFEECYRVLYLGGFALFETPNPKNIVTGTNNFYIDPSHIRPIPSELLAFSLESIGFEPEVRPAHPRRDKITHKDKEVAQLMNLAYGPQDYAVIARKKQLN